MRPVATRGEMSKRKIQAQRKFAQGAIIPTTPNNVVVRNDIGNINVKEDQNIIHSNLSAKSLLDIVSFQSIHAHRSPVVLLERLETKPLQVPKPMSLKDRRNTITKKAPTKLTKKPVVKKPVVPKVIRQKRTSETLSTDDDEKPLKFLKQHLDQRQATLPGRPKTRTYTKYHANELNKTINKEKKDNHLKSAHAVNTLLTRKNRYPKPEASNSVTQESNAVKKIPNSEKGNHISDLMPQKSTSVQESNAVKKTHNSETGNSQVKENVITMRRISNLMPEKTTSVQESNAGKKIPNSETGNHLKNNSQVKQNVITIRRISDLMPEKSASVQESNAVKKTHNSETGNSQVKQNVIALRRISDLMPEKSTSVQEINAIKKIPNSEIVPDVKRAQREESTPEKVKEISREKKLPDEETVNGETVLSGKDDSSECSTGSNIRLEYLDSDADDNDIIPNRDNEIPDETTEVTPAIVHVNNVVQDIRTDADGKDIIPDRDNEKPHETTEVTPAIVHVNNVVQDIRAESSIKEPCPGTSGALFKKPDEKSFKHELPKKTTDASTSTNHEEISLQDINPDLDAIGPAQKDKEPKTGQFYGNTGIRTWMDSARPHCETANQPESTKKPCNDVYQFDPEMENRPYSKFERNKKSEGPVSYINVYPKSNQFIVKMTPDKNIILDDMLIVNASIVKRNMALNNNDDNVERNDNFQRLINNTLSRNNSQIAPKDNSEVVEDHSEVVCIESASDDDVVEVASSIADPDSGAVPPAGRLLGQPPSAGTSTLTPTPGIAVKIPGNVTQQTDRLNPPSVSNATKDTRRTRYKPRPSNKNSNIVNAPVFYPTEEDFKDPIAFFEKASTTAGKFGLCKVVAPSSFKPTCKQVDINFRVDNQYIARMYNRWGPAAREMSTIKAYLYSQNVIFTRPPLHEGLELNLPKLYRLVQRNGGLNQVIEKERWSDVAGGMRCTKSQKASRRLDKLYVKYLLPYYTLSNQERQQTTAAVEKGWNQKNQKLLEWALNPLHRQKKLLGDSDSSEDEQEAEPQIKSALADAEDCVVKGRNMNLATFEKIAKTADEIFFPTPSRTAADVEDMYWRTMLLGSEHICVNSASIDTGHAGYGFTNNRAEPFGTHPWNLKMISENSGNVLRSLRAVLGVTVPTLHLGMVFSTSCWHRDPHGLPWMEYMHSGPAKIWYGIPNEQSSNFRKAVETLCPSSCQTKSIWLPSDVTMIPPNLLQEHNVSLSRVEQHPGEFVIVFPKAYSCSISTGFTQSESAYFATSSWLNSVHQVFQELRDSCEPTTFSLEQLLIALAEDVRVPLGLLPQVHSSLKPIITEELNYRRQLEQRGLEYPQKVNYWPMYRTGTAWNVRDFDECEICRTTLYLSKVTGITGRHSKVCLQHALRLLDTPRHSTVDVSQVQLLIAFTEKDLTGFILTVHDRLFGKRK